MKMDVVVDLYICWQDLDASGVPLEWHAGVVCRLNENTIAQLRLLSLHTATDVSEYVSIL